MSKNSKLLLAGIDTGGTFTDVVVISGGRIKTCKVLSTPDDPSRAIFEGLDRLGVADKPLLIVHGTTVGTNAVLERKGARVAYVTSRGFADVLTLGRQNRDQVYSLRQPELTPPVSEDLCLEVSTRISAEGEILEAASDEELEALQQQIEELQPESVAINLLFSFLQPEQEQRIADATGGDRFVSLSSRVLPEIREYERGIATWLDASVGPVISRYLDRLGKRLPRASIAVLQSSGTTIAASQAASQAVRLLLSGPAGGLAAAHMAGRAMGQTRLLTFDMGGTSTDVALLDGQIPLSSESRVGDWPLNVPSVDIHTIGAGGGSIARVDRGGLLLVGPESAGAMPGPACYGLGGSEVTVTDANMVLGRIPDDTLLGGYLPLDGEAAAAAVSGLAAELGCNRLEAARGVIRLANEHMARALRVISVERGHDPRQYTLFCFGGAGGLHACELADLLEIPRVILPAAAGVLSALGMLASQPGRDLSRAVLKDISTVSDAFLKEQFGVLEQQARQQLENEGVPADQQSFRYQIELRYRGQSAGFVLDFVPGADHAAEFHEVHEASAGHRLSHAVELVNLRLGARGPAATTVPEKPAFPQESAKPKNIYLADIKGVAEVWERRHLNLESRICGPAIVTEPAATAWVAAGWEAQPDEWGNLCLQKTVPGAP